MQRAALLLILCCSALPAFAQNGRGAGIVALTADHTPCDEVVDNRKAAPGPATSKSRPLANHANKTPAKSTLPTGGGMSHGGGGDDVDAALQRSRSPKWHSFLPGMFR